MDITVSRDIAAPPVGTRWRETRTMFGRLFAGATRMLLQQDLDDVGAAAELGQAG